MEDDITSKNCKTERWLCYFIKSSVQSCFIEFQAKMKRKKVTPVNDAAVSDCVKDKKVHKGSFAPK